MAPNPLWSGSIAFGPWDLEVQLYAAVAAASGRIQLRDRRELVLEVEQGRFVPLEPGDLDRVDIELAHAIELRDFVMVGKIDPVRLGQAYYLVPCEGAERPYRLLARALEETDRVGIATVAIRAELHPACLRAADGVLVLQPMYPPDALLRPEVWVDGDAGEQDVEEAKSLVERFHARTTA